MSVIRKRKKRLDPSLQQVDSALLLMKAPGWYWSVKTKSSHRRTQDFRLWRDNGRCELGAALRDAHWILSTQEAGATTRGRYLWISAIWRFLEEIDPERKINQLSDIDFEFYENYRAWLSRQLTLSGPNQGKPLHPSSVYEGVACLKVLLENRVEYASNQIHASLQTATLKLPAYVRCDARQPYSVNESRRIMKTMQSIISAAKTDQWQGLDCDVVIAALILLAFRTGGNLTPLLELTIHAMHPHPADKHRVILVLEKKRARDKKIRQVHSQGVSEGTDSGLQKEVLFAKTSSSSRVMDLFAYLIKRNTLLRESALPEEQNSLWLYQRANDHSRVVSLTDSMVANRLRAIVTREQLKNDRGQRLSIALSRIRRTFTQRIYELSGYDAKVTQELAGHSNMSTTCRHYLSVTERMEQQFSLFQQALAQWAQGNEQWVTRKIAKQLAVPEEEAKQLLSGHNKTHIASCSDSHYGRYAPKNGEVCTHYMYCFKCPNMVVLKDDLWRLFSFRNALIADRDSGRIPLLIWAEQFSWMVRVIDHGISQLFDQADVNAAKHQAKENPYPLWQSLPVEQVIQWHDKEGK